MMLYLLRHGAAEPQAGSDAGRRLTPQGCTEVDSVAHQFQLRHLPLDVCYCSPYLRALQTAQRFLAQVAPALPLCETAVLTPEVRANEVMEFLQGCNERHVLLVSHNPLLSELNALLTEGSISHMHILGTSELVAMEVEVLGLGMGRSSLRLMPGVAPVAS